MALDWTKAKRLYDKESEEQEQLDTSLLQEQADGKSIVPIEDFSGVEVAEKDRQKHAASQLLAQEMGIDQKSTQPMVANLDLPQLVQPADPTDLPAVNKSFQPGGPYIPYEGAGNEFSKAFKNMSLVSMAAYLDKASKVLFAPSKGVETLYLSGAGSIPRSPEVGARHYEKWAADKASDLYKQAQSPDLMPATDGGWQAFTARAFGSSIPFAMASMGVTMLVGPLGGFEVASTIEGYSAYKEALERDVPEEKARWIGLGVGTINGLLETLQLSKGMRFGSETLETVMKSSRKNIGKNIQGVGRWTMKAAETAGFEGVIETLQEQGPMFGPAIFGADLPSVEEWLSRSGESFAAGVVITPLHGAGGAAVGYTVRRAQKAVAQKKAVKRAKATAKEFDEPTDLDQSGQVPPISDLEIGVPQKEVATPGADPKDFTETTEVIMEDPESAQNMAQSLAQAIIDTEGAQGDVIIDGNKVIAKTSSPESFSASEELQGIFDEAQALYEQNKDLGLPDDPGLADQGQAELAQASARAQVDPVKPAVKRSGKPKYKANLYRGVGATPEQVYGDKAVEDGRAVPILGAGTYYANTEEDASLYGETSEHDVQLYNPLVIHSDREWDALLGLADTKILSSVSIEFYENPQGVPAATEKLKSYIQSKGYDGVIIEGTEQNKRLSESFGHDQVVSYSAQETITVHSMPDGTLMQGEAHEGAVAGSETQITQEVFDNVKTQAKTQAETETETKILEDIQAVQATETALQAAKPPEGVTATVTLDDEQARTARGVVDEGTPIADPARPIRTQTRERYVQQAESAGLTPQQANANAELIDAFLTNRVVATGVEPDLPSAWAGVPDIVAGRPGPEALTQRAFSREQAISAIKKRGVGGDDLLNAGDFIDEVRSIDSAAKIDSDGYITLYHRTSEANANKMVNDQFMITKENGIFFGSRATGQISGYGESVIQVRVPVENLELNDVFTDEAHFRYLDAVPGDKTFLAITKVDPDSQTQGTAVDLKTISQNWNDQGVDNVIFETTSQVNISKVVVPVGERGQGTGTAFINDVIQYADSVGKTVVLTPSVEFGATSLARLKRFYKGLGFVENKGKKRDDGIFDSMYRHPFGAASLLQTGDQVQGAFDPANNLIHVLDTANASTLPHEIMHWIVETERTLDPQSAHLLILEDWLGIKNKEWKTADHEKVARSFERYLHTGKAPNSKLTRVFEYFKNLLKDVYGRIKDSAIDIKLSKAVTNFFEQVLGPEGDVSGKPKFAGDAVRPAPGQRGVARKDIVDYDVYQDIRQDVLERAANLGPGPFYVDPINKQDVIEAVGQMEVSPSAMEIFSFDKTKAGLQWDVAAQQAGIEITDPFTFAQYAVDIWQAQQSKTVISPAVLDAAVATGDPVMAMMAERYELLKDPRLSAQEINRTLKEIQEFHQLSDESVEGLFVFDEGTPMVSPGSTQAERQAIAQQMQSILRAKGVKNITKTQIGQAVETGLSQAQEAGQKAGYKYGEVIKTEEIQKLKAKQDSVAAAWDERIAAVRAHAKDKVAAERKVQQARRSEQEGFKKELRQAVNKNLPLRERGKLLAMIESATTERKFLSAMRRVEELSEKSNQAIVRTQILRELGFSKPKLQSGKPKGKLSPETQQALDKISNDVEVFRTANRFEINQEIGEIVAGLTSAEATDVPRGKLLERIEEIKYMGFDNMTSREMAGMLRDIKEIRKDGKTQHQKFLDDRLQRIGKVTIDAMQVITAGKGLKGTGSSLPGENVKPKSFLFDKFLNLKLWYNLMDSLDQADSTTVPRQGVMGQWARGLPWASSLAETQGLIEHTEKITSGAKEVFGDNWQQEIQELNQKIRLGPWTNVDGEEGFFEGTVDSFLKKFMEMQDPTLESTFRGLIDRNGRQRGMRWSDEMFDMVRNSLTAKQREWGFWMLDYYRSYYETVNEVYRKQYFIDLPYNPYYSPVVREVAGTQIPEDVALGQRMLYWATPTSGSLKSRVQNMQKLRQIGATSTLMRHLAEMEHFKAWSATMVDLQAVFKNKDIREAIEQNYGVRMRQVIDDHLATFARGGTDYSRISKDWDRVRGKMVKAMIARPSVPVKQPLSIWAYSERIGWKDLGTGIVDLFTAPGPEGKTALEKAEWMRKNNALMKQRWSGGYSRDVKDILRKGPIAQITGKNKLMDVLSTMGVQEFDKGTTIIGTWASYKHYKSQGLSSQAALDQAAIDTLELQPSGDVVGLSWLQTRSSAYKLLTTFQNQPIKYFNMLDAALRNWKAGRGSKIKHGSTIVGVWALAPMLFQFVSDAFRFDPENQLRAFLLGPLNTIPIVNNLAKLAYGTYANQWAPEQLDVFTSVAVKTVKGVANTAEDFSDGVDFEEFMEAIELIVETAGYATGTPGPYAAQIIKAVRTNDPAGVIFSAYSRGINTNEKKKTGKKKSSPIF